MSTKILGDEKFSVWVKKVRDKTGLSHSGVEKKSRKGISKSYVGHLETEKVTPADLTLKKLIGLANGLGISPYELVNVAIQDELNKTQNLVNAQELATSSKNKILLKKEKADIIHKKAG